MLPIYNSADTDNEIRIATASSYACAAGVNAIQVLNDLIGFHGSIAGSGFFEFLVQEFPASTDTVDNKKAQAAQNAIDAAFSVINPGTILTPAYLVNVNSYNPGSILTTDRAQGANALLSFLGMSSAGTLLSRAGLPSANYHKSVPLPWILAPDTKGDGCALAAALLIFNDSIAYISSISPAGATDIYADIKGFLSAGLDGACQMGCNLCGGGMSCQTCPISLRDRTSCTGLITDVNSCAASGIARFVDTVWQGPP